MLVLHCQILCFVKRVALYNLVNKANWCTIFLILLISFLWVFRATLHNKQSSIQNNKYQVSLNKFVSHDDVHIVARNMYRKKINLLRDIVHQVVFTYKILQFDFYLW
jgi:hypothetical protein